MGIDYHVYIGPYLACKYHMVEYYTTTRSCSRPKCDKHLKLVDTFTEYCPRCGSPIRDVEHVKEIASDWDEKDAYEITGGSLYAANTYMISADEHIRFVLPNKNRYAPSEYSFDPKHDEVWQQVGEANIVRDIHWLQTAFASEIGLLRDSGVYDNVEVQWGVLMWRS